MCTSNPFDYILRLGFINVTIDYNVLYPNGQCISNFLETHSHHVSMMRGCNPFLEHDLKLIYWSINRDSSLWLQTFIMKTKIREILKKDNKRFRGASSMGRSLKFCVMVTGSHGTIWWTVMREVRRRSLTIWTQTMSFAWI